MGSSSVSIATPSGSQTQQTNPRDVESQVIINDPNIDTRGEKIILLVGVTLISLLWFAYFYKYPAQEHW